MYLARIEEARVSGRKVYYQESDPATHDSYGAIGANEHQGQELVSTAKDDAVDEGRVCDQRDRYSDVKEGEPVEEEYAGLR